MTAAVAAVLAAAIASAAAQSPAVALEVSLDVDRCPFLPRDQVFELVAVELDARVATPARAGEQATRIDVACGDTGEVELKVSDRLTGNVLTRTMALGVRDPQTAARMVAIAAAELVLTTWVQRTLTRPSAAPSAGAPSSPELRRVAQELAQRHLPRSAGTGYLLAVAQAVGPFAGVGVAWGGGLRFGWTPGHMDVENDAWSWRPGLDLELTAARNGASRGIGAVDVSMVSAAVRVSFRLTRARSWLDAGAGGRAGVARIEGIPGDVTTTRGATLAGTWAGPIAYIGVGRRFWRLVAAAGIEGGTVLRGISGLVDDGGSVSVAGRWVSGTLAIGWGG